ncbi:3'(2'),5'-bisphosphate nucleotidase [Alteripontixanthobacter maritimus]|uniref:3'(2'),5'-bisphosphate nucleotidase n=1 Tax=Alteripontixanthobacter maritimus TaxID=2161824 RepID=A0A369QA55_9SPHN|nr:3'(2'),5'-bisphosphate nucleotidase CysQ [Alteripontixanthobacter maritimus]RDC59168.1 3'(2'),5'-bisphosphate nucleotidase [Alteripontixanthobacter maritimus]
MSKLGNLSDAALAAHLAHEAGRIALRVRAESGLEGRGLGDEGDRRANEYLVAALREARPDDGILSEESKDTEARLSKSRVWIVDPVDGTREYGEGRSDWAVHVALSVDGAPTIGAVALPGLAGGTVLRSDEVRPLEPYDAAPRFLVSRSRPAKEAVAVAEAMGGDLIPMGSAGAKAMAVVRGEAEIYLHSGGQYEWDNCAPAAVALAHGLHASRIDGAPLTYNHRETWLPDLLICRPELAGQVLKLVSDLPVSE